MNLEPWPTVSSATAQKWVVACVQHLLLYRGQTLAVDGTYGPKTTAAVSAFQTSQGLAADGLVGPKTWGKLVTTISSASTGEAVRALQALELVHIPGEPPLTVDGAFGAETEGRVRTLQVIYGLEEDGVVGTQTWSFAAASNPWPLVRQGATMSSNHRVLTVQYLLRAHKAALGADGVYGPQTGAAMKAFQKTLRNDDLSTTCGQLDWPKLVVKAKLGDKGDAVSAAQHLLADIAADGIFGAATKKAVTDFQRMWGLTADGVVGAKTWEVLVKPKFD